MKELAAARVAARTSIERLRLTSCCLSLAPVRTL
ncbi:MAG: hypothetical protein K0S19_1922, partial [Geminicoccaceae bacterium]|nr:hypothetical protein [Geminicoccaceae bacterium]